MDRRKVTMVNLSANNDGSITRRQAEDFVAEEHLDAYVADALTRWQSVTVSDEIDHGPGGPDGHYAAPNV